MRYITDEDLKSAYNAAIKAFKVERLLRVGNAPQGEQHPGSTPGISTNNTRGTAMERIVQETPACTAVQFHDETDTEIIEEVYGNHTQGVDYTLYLRRPEDDSRWRVSMHVDTSYWHQSRLSVTRWNGERWYGAFDPPRDSMKVFVHHHGPGTVYIGAKPTREALRYLAATWIVAALRVVPV